LFGEPLALLFNIIVKRPLLLLRAGLPFLVSLVPMELARAQVQPRPMHDWSRVAALGAGTEIKVKTTATTEAWKGAFTRADSQSVSFLIAPGKQKQIDFSEVQEVVRVRKSARYAPLIGGLAGALAMTLFTSRKGNDLSGRGVALFIGGGAGIGALAGTGAGAALRNTVVFRRP